MKKQLLRTILFLSFLLLVNCQNDNADSYHEHGEKVIANSINLETFKSRFNLSQSGKLFEKFDINSPDQLQQRTASGNFISIIHTDEITYFELENGMATYTFRATTNIENDPAITNVVYYTQGGTAFDFKVIRYIPDEGWLNDYKNGIHNDYLGEFEGYSSSEVSLDNVTLNRGYSEPCVLRLPIWRCIAGNAHSPEDHLNGTCQVGGNTIVGFNFVWGDCPTPGEGTGGGGGSGGTNPNPGGEIIVVPTKPLILIAFGVEHFLNNLDVGQKLWWNTVETEVKESIIFFLQKNKIQEAENYAEELIAFARLNNNSPEALQEIKNILDILDDGLLGGQPVVVGPDLPITNMAEYLSIFNTSQPATITLYADQPITGSQFPFTLNSAKAGHAFISIKQGTKVRSFGFYPQNTLASGIPNPITIDPTDFFPTPSSFGNDQGHDFDVSISKSITATQLSNTINLIVATFHSNPPYNLGSLNCVDFAITVFESNTNINIPSSESPGPWNGQTPATLGQVLRTMTLPAGATKNTTGGSAPSNNSN